MMAGHMGFKDHSQQGLPQTQQDAFYARQQQGENDFISFQRAHNFKYGGMAPPIYKRQRINIVAVCQNLFIPWILYCLMFWNVSFYFHFRIAWLCWLLVGIGAIPVVLVGVAAGVKIASKWRGETTRQPSWLIFLFVSLVMAYVLGIVIGDLNYWQYMQPYYEVSHLRNVTGINPATMRGEQFMDGGLLNFQENAVLDLRRSMGFKNLDTYCVAPITASSSFGPIPLSQYDFWAVGKGCCSPNSADFHCGAYQQTRGHGLRYLQDEDRPFFRLAVQQAEAAYAIKAVHPIFMYWVTDAAAEAQSYREEAYKFCFIAMLVHLFFQLLCVILATVGFSNMGHY